MKKDLKIVIGLMSIVLLRLADLSWAQAPVQAGQELGPKTQDRAQGVKNARDANPVISLDYSDADINAVLRSLSLSYGLNLVTGTDVKGKVTIKLDEVTLNDALDAILSACGYTYSRRANIIYISPGVSDSIDLASEPFFLKYLKAAGVQNLLRKTISAKGDVKVDESSNMLIVTDFPAHIDKIRQLIKSIDIAPEQVLIEVKIVDITSKDLQNLGVTWQADYKPAGGVKSLFGRTTKFQEELKATTTVAGPSSSLSGGQFKVDTLTFKGLSLTATLDALVQDQKAHLLASPSIAVLNNHEARIVIGEKVPYKERTQTTTGTTETTKFIDVGTTLRVIPTINSDGYITMMVHPEVSSVSALLDAGPRITTREADTTVRIKEGETVVIGGLIKQQDDSTRSKVPLLGSIPILSLFFSNRSKDRTQTELAVFITPKILRSHEEAKLTRKDNEEVYISINPVAELTLAYKLFEKADRLDRGVELEGRRKDAGFRKAQALGLFEHIISQFPDSPKAMEAAYRSILIYHDYEKDLLKTRGACEKFISDYPESEFTGRVKTVYKKVAAALQVRKGLLSEDKLKSFEGAELFPLKPPLSGK